MNPAPPVMRIFTSSSLGLLSEVFDRPAQPFFEIHLRLPAEQLLRPPDVGLAYLGIVDRKRAVDDAARAAHQANDGLGEGEHVHLARIAEVHRAVGIRSE